MVGCGRLWAATLDVFVQRAVDEAVLVDVPGRLGAVRYAELAIDVRQVELHRLLGEEELLRDLLIRSARLQYLEDRELAVAQPGLRLGVRLRRDHRSPGGGCQVWRVAFSSQLVARS